MENGAMYRKIWALEPFKGKMVISGYSKGFLESLEWLEGLGAKD
jgi:hypothetical protein